MKRITAIILALILAALQMPVLAAQSSTTFNQKYYVEAMELLGALNIIPDSDGGVLIEKDISRIDLLETVIKAITNNGVEGYSNVFTGYTDVPDTKMGYVKYALYLGMIPAGTTLRPDEAADIDFAKMIMAGASGCELDANEYNREARELDLTKNVRSEAVKSLKMGDAFVMVYNFIVNANVPKLLIYSQDGNDSILSLIYKVNSIKARLIATEDTAVDDDVCKRNHLRFQAASGTGDITLEVAEDITNAEDLLGRYVKVFYDEDDKVVSMSPLYDTDILVEINSQTYNGYNPWTRQISWDEYRESNRWESSVREKNKEIPRTADIIFNGKYTTQHTEVYNILSSGNGYDIDSIELISGEDNGKVDLVKIRAYKSYVVKSANEETLVIKHEGNGENIDYDEWDQELEIDVVNTNGEQMKFSAIPAKSVISVFEALDNVSYIKMIVSSQTTSTMVTGFNKDDEDRDYMVTEDAEYKLSANSTFSVDDIKTGSEYTFYLDHCGKVCGYALNLSKGLFVGGIMDVVKNLDMEQGVWCLEFEIFTADGEVLTCKNAEKWYVDNNIVTCNDELMKMTYVDQTGSIIDVKDKTEGELVQILLNSDGEVKKIFTPKKNAKKGELGYTLGMNNPENVFNDVEGNRLMYKSGSKYFFPYDTSVASMNFVAIDSKTKVIQMPSKKIEYDREKYFDVLEPTFSNDSQRTVIGYTLSGPEDLIADIMVVVTDSASSPKNGPVRVVKKKTMALNSDDEVCYKLSLVDANGNEETVFTEEQSFPGFENDSSTSTNLDIEIGDIIRYGKNAGGFANSFIKVYDESSGAIEEKDANYWYSASRVVKGCVYSTDENKFTYIVGDSISGSVDGKLQLGNADTVIFFDKNEGADERLKVGKASDLVGYKENTAAYSKVIIMTGYGDMKTICSYK